MNSKKGGIYMQGKHAKLGQDYKIKGKVGDINQ